MPFPPIAITQSVPLPIPPSASIPAVDATDAAYFWEIGITFMVTRKQELVASYRQMRINDDLDTDYTVFKLGYRFW